MILPVVAYGDPVLKKKASSISKDYPKINSLISTCMILCMVRMELD